MLTVYKVYSILYVQVKLKIGGALRFERIFLSLFLLHAIHAISEPISIATFQVELVAPTETQFIIFHDHVIIINIIIVVINAL